MKQQKRFLLIAVLIFMLTEYTSSPAKAQTAEPPSKSCGSDDYIGPVAFSPDGRYLGAVLEFSHSIQIWDVKTGKRVSTMTDERIENRDNELLVFSPNNEYIVYASNATGVALWNVGSGKLERIFKSLHIPSDMPEITSVSFSPDGHSILATEEATGHIIWDVESGREEILFAEPGYLHSQFSPDGTVVLTQQAYPPISIWDRKTGKRLHAFDIPTMGWSDGVFTPDGRYILVPKENGTILADAKTYRTVHVLGEAYSRWQFSPDGKYALTRKEPGKPGSIYVWNLEEGTLVREFTAFTPLDADIITGFIDNKTILIAKYSSQTPQPHSVLSIHNIQTGEEIRAYTIGYAYENLGFELTHDAKYFAIITPYPHILTLWDTQTGKQKYLDC